MTRLVAVAVLAGCATEASNQRVEVHLRSLADVRVEVDTPAGRRVLLPAGSGGSDAVVPTTEPPFEHEVRFDATVAREPDGDVVVRCGGCGSGPFHHPLGSTDLVFPGATYARDVVQLTPGELHIPFAYPWTMYAPVLYIRGSGMPPPRGDAFHLDLVTPLGNVVDIHELTDNPRRGALSTIRNGILVTVIGAAAIAGAVVLSDHHGGLAEAGADTLGIVGVPVFVIGPFYIGQGISDLHAVVWDRTIYPAR
jgi:hypothetical protein